MKKWKLKHCSVFFRQNDFENYKLNYKFFSVYLWELKAQIIYFFILKLLRETIICNSSKDLELPNA